MVEVKKIEGYTDICNPDKDLLVVPYDVEFILEKDLKEIEKEFGDVGDRGNSVVEFLELVYLMEGNGKVIRIPKLLKPAIVKTR